MKHRIRTTVVLTLTSLLLAGITDTATATPATGSSAAPSSHRAGGPGAAADEVRYVISSAGPDRAFGPNDRVLDVAAWSLADRGRVHMWDFRTTGDVTNQRWDLVYITDHNGFSYFQIVNKHSGKCLDKSMDAGNVDGAQVYQYSCSNSSANQQWRIDWECDFCDFFQLHDYADNRCLDIRNKVDANDASLQVWTCGFHAWNQEWYYTIESA